MKTKGIYAGSFDPFTNGHMQIVNDALMLFDEVIVLIAINSAKRRRLSVEQTKKAIEATFENNPNVSVQFYSGFVADFCFQNNISFLIRGLRNATDFDHEETIAKINAEINPKVKTVYFRTSNEIISSSMVWELHLNGKDVSGYVPPAVLKELNSYKLSAL